MQKFNKLLVSLLSCCLVPAMVFAASCGSSTSDSSDSDSTSTNSSSTDTGTSGTGDSSTADSSSGGSSTEDSSSGGSSTEDSSSGGSSTEDSSSGDSSTEDSSTTDSSAAESTAESSEGEDEGSYPYTSTTVYFVGDSTVCSFTDSYYLPRYGYGTQFGNYVDSDYVSVVNLALSGRSSRSYIEEDNYTTLTESIKKGDYLIIGFGHNDEKEETSTDHRYTSPETDAVDTEGSFQYYLYNYYIKVAEDIGATPILCTPIVRYNSSANYTGSSGHVTDDGDYAACIRDLADDYNITCVDLTSITTELYTTLGTEAQWFHAHTSAKISDDESARTIYVKGNTTTVNVVPSGMDSTHLNMYGAKMVAYQIATALQENRKTCNLGYYVLDSITEPTADDLEAAYNSDYYYVNYDAFDSENDASKYWTLSTSGWYGTAFGDTGTSDWTNYYTISDTIDADTGESTITVGQTGSGTKGKIGSTEGIAMAFMQLAYNQNFEMTVTATVTQANLSTTSGTAAGTQAGFGLMLRDDIYIDTQDSSILSNYIASGMYVSSSGSNIIYYREDTTLTTSSSSNKASAFKVGDTATLTIVRQGQTYSCTVVYGNTTYTYDAFDDFDLVAVDGDYIYLGVYATRGTVVEFSNITYTATGTAVEA